ncbi:cytochrome P450 26B1-like [Styela clava]
MMLAIGFFVHWFFDIASTIGTYFGITISLLFLSKFLWRKYILKTAEDSTSSLTASLPLPPGDFGIPFIGETLSWVIQGSKFNSSRRKQYGKIFSTHFLGKPVIKVTGAENVRQILQGEHDKVTTIWPTTVRRIVGEHSIANCRGDQHKYIRKLALRGFTHTSLNSYIEDARKTISNKIRSWRTHAGTARKIYTDLLQMTFEISAKAMVGLKFKNDEEKTEAFTNFHEMIKNLFSLPYDLPFSGFRKGLQKKEWIHKMLDSHLKNKLKYARSRGNDLEEPENDVVHYMLQGEIAERQKNEGRDSGIDSERSSEDEEERGISMNELKQNVVELMFAGFLTTGSSISSLIIQLAKHPEIRKKVEEELEEQGYLSSDDIEIDLEKIQKLTYLEQVIKETLRLMPPILGGYRRAMKTFQIGDYRIPKDWTIIYNIRDTHEYEFQDDTEFDPDRFSREKWTENRQNRFKWLPFGGGPRVCVGKEFARLVIKLTTIELFKSFSDWRFENDKAPPMFPIPTLHPTNGLPIIFTKR